MLNKYFSYVCFTAKLMQEARVIIEKFIKKNPDSWPDKIDFCLLPLRLAHTTPRYKCISYKFSLLSMSQNFRT